MKTKCLIFIIVTAILLSACVSQKKKEQTISLSGAFAIYPLVVKWSEEYQKEHPEVRFNISAGGAGKGMADALAGTVDLGMFSREILQEEIDKGVWWVALTIDAVLPTVSADNPNLGKLKTRGVTRNEFTKIFIEGSIKSWAELTETSETPDIVVYTRSDACGAAGTWAKYLGGKQENLDGIGIYGDPGLAEAVAKDPFGLGFNNTIYIYDINTGKKRPGIEVIPIDINDNGKIDAEEDFYNSFDTILKAIADGIYPSPPVLRFPERWLIPNPGVTETDTTNTINFRQTSGIYTDFRNDNLKICGNIYYQYGKYKAGINVNAFLFDTDVSYEISNLTPGFGISHLSGNRKTGVDLITDNLFDNLYGARHKYFGFIDYFRSFPPDTKQGGLTDYYIYLDYQFSKTISVRNIGHYFRLAQTNATTPDDKNLGYENDLVVRYKFSNCIGLDSGYMFFLATNSLRTIQNVQNDKFSQFFYLQLTITPVLFTQQYAESL